jgi:hypothetical protein
VENYPAKVKRKIVGFRSHGKKKKRKKKKKKRSLGRNEILFYFEIFIFDTSGPDTTVDPLAVTMLVLATGRCIS